MIPAAQILSRPRGRRIGFVGLGLTSAATARYLQSQGALVLISEMRDRSDVPRDLQEAALGLDVEWGGHSEAFLGHCEVAIVSPGVPPGAKVLRSLEARGISLAGDLDVAGPLLKGRTLGVTGTKGKSGTARLASLGAEGQARPVLLGGNMDPPAIQLVDDSREAGINVLELSSFGLARSRGLSLDVAVVTNLGADHLDAYASLEDYHRDKLRILEALPPNGCLVLPWDDAEVSEFHRGAPCPVLYFCDGPMEGPGLFWADGILHQRDRQGGVQVLGPCPAAAFERRVHRLNLAAALAGLGALGLDLSRAVDVCQSFTGLPHRQEELAAFQGRRFFNDSKGTDLKSLEAALRDIPGPLRLLCGGILKGGDPADLRGLAQEKASGIYGFGKDGPSMVRALGSEDRAHGTLSQAMEAALADLVAGESLVLSPGGSSFDEFSSAEARGEFFKERVSSWCRGQGGGS